MIKLPIFLIFISLSYAYYPIHCGNGYEAFLRNDGSKEVICDSKIPGVKWNPELPKYLDYESGKIMGTMHEEVYLKPYMFFSNSEEGLLWITAGYEIKQFSCGISRKRIITNTPFAPIRCIGDSFIEEYSIKPELPVGLQLDPVLGIINGTYSGDAKTVEYTVSARNKYNSIETTFILEYTDASSVSTSGYTECVYNTQYVYHSMSDMFSQFMPGNCTYSTQDMDFSYKSEAKDLSRRAHIYSGYLIIQEDTTYSFEVRSTGFVMLFIDNAEDPLITNESDEPVPAEGSIELKKGLHLFRVYHYEMELVDQLSILMGTKETQKSVLTKNNLFVGGYVPALHKVYDAVFPVNTHIQSKSPISRATHITLFTITPDLPSGIVFDKTKGIIEGSLSSPYFGYHTIVAMNENGISNPMTLMVSIASPLSGLQASYYTADDIVNICSGLDTYNMGLFTLVTKQIETDFNRPIQPKYSYWGDVASIVFQHSAYAQFTGFALITKVGLYSFSISMVDGLQVTIDGQPLFKDSWKCESSGRVADLQIDWAGYHSVVIDWMTKGDEFGLVLLMKAPEETEFHAIPSDFFVTVPSAPFAYSTLVNVYTKNKKIRPNNPVYLLEPSSGVSYDVEPGLPQGLMMDHGVIYGTPEEETKRAEYTITSTDATLVLKAILILEVAEFLIPENVTITNEAGEAIKDVVFPIYAPIGKLTLSCSMKEVVYTIVPELPAGIQFDLQHRIISGTPTSHMDTTVYTITATAVSGVASMTLRITVPSCEYGHFFYVSSNNRLHYNMSTMQGDPVKIESGDFDHQFYFCISPADYNVTTTADYSNYYEIIREDGMKFYNGRSNEEGGVIVSFHPTAPPTITFTYETCYGVVGYYSYCPFTVSYIHDEIVSTGLPDGMSLLTDFGYITGKAKNKGVYDIRMSTRNDVGTTYVVLRYYISSCPKEKELVYGERYHTGLSYMYTLFDETTQTMIMGDSVKGNQDDSIIALCMEDHRYALTMKEGKSEGIIRMRFRDENNNTLAMLTVKEDSTSTQYLHLIHPVSEPTPWKVFVDGPSPDSKWVESGYRERRWEEQMTPILGPFRDKQITRYLRKTISINSQDFYPGFLFEIRHSGGFILYINGAEHLRVNLPSVVVPTTKALNTSKTTEWTRMSVSNDKLVPGENVIAVEIHSFDTNEPFLFSMKSRIVTVRSHAVDYDGLIEASDHYVEEKYRKENAFEGENSAFWRDTGLPCFIRYVFPEDRQEFINRVTLRSPYSAENEMPSVFTIFGIREDGEEEELRSIVNEKLFKQGMEDVTIPLFLNRPYHGYGIRVFNTTGDSDAVLLNKVMFAYHPDVKCYGDKDLPSTTEGKNSYTNCNIFHIGKVTHYCVSNGTKWWWGKDESTCLSRIGGKTEAFIDVDYVLYGSSFPEYSAFFTSEFPRILSEGMLIRKSDVLMYYPHDCGQDPYNPVICYSIRVYPSALAAEYVKLQLIDLNRNITGVFRASSTMENKNLQIVVDGEVHLRQLPKDSTLISLALLLVAVVIIIFLLIVLSKRNALVRSLQRKNLVEKAKKSKLKSSQESLLESSKVYFCLIRNTTTFYAFPFPSPHPLHHRSSPYFHLAFRVFLKESRIEAAWVVPMKR